MCRRGDRGREAGGHITCAVAGLAGAFGSHWRRGLTCWPGAGSGTADAGAARVCGLVNEGVMRVGIWPAHRRGERARERHKYNGISRAHLHDDRRIDRAQTA